ncbi:MAG TPA: hypothetical protein VJ779_09570 [Acetobacteraceae bacterium]|nr:hypothetical protein [Acetobacteraceae bacterium]
MAEDWRDRIRAIADALLTLEINTIEKSNMSAQKMPEVPVALHNIVDAYALYLAKRGYLVTASLYDDACAHILALAETAQPDSCLDRLKGFAPAPGAVQTDPLTNGPGTFEALQWLAFAALRLGAPQGYPPFTEEERGVLARIRANSRQLREAARQLDQLFANTPAAALFDTTLDKTIAGLMASPRPVLRIDTDVTLLVRKAWDIGTETVLFQTALQVDGDVVMRVSPQLEEEKRAFFTDLHKATVEIGIRQWTALFELVRSLVGTLGRELFGI